MDADTYITLVMQHRNWMLHNAGLCLPHPQHGPQSRKTSEKGAVYATPRMVCVSSAKSKHLFNDQLDVLQEHAQFLNGKHCIFKQSRTNKYVPAAAAKDRAPRDQRCPPSIDPPRTGSGQCTFKRFDQKVKVLKDNQLTPD